MEKGNGCCFSSVSSSVILSSVAFVVILIFVRVLHVMYCSGRPLNKRASKPVSTLIILGSGSRLPFLFFHPYQNILWKLRNFKFYYAVGGHTAEMLNLLAVLQKDRFYPRFYIAAATDNMSLQKALLLENSLASEVMFCKIVSTSTFDLTSSVFFPLVIIIVVF
jgi:beta-1,4-N-acetylglucosaminyltransferase